MFSKIPLQTARVPGGDDSRSVHRLSEQPHKHNGGRGARGASSREQPAAWGQGSQAPARTWAPPPLHWASLPPPSTERLHLPPPRGVSPPPMGRLSSPPPHRASPCTPSGASMSPAQGLTSPVGKMSPLQASGLRLLDEEKSLLISEDLWRALPGADAPGSGSQRVSFQ